MSDEEVTQGLDEQVETAPGETTDEKFEESLDDVKKARAYQQTKAQELAEENKALETQLNDAIGKYQGGVQMPPAQAAAEAPPTGDSSEDDFDDPVVKKLTAFEKRVDQRFAQMEQSNLTAQQFEWQKQHAAEVAAVTTPLKTMVQKALTDKRVTQEQVAEAVDYARTFVPDQMYSNNIGAPSQHAAIFRDKLRLLELEGEKARPTATRGTAEDKREAMNETTHPATGAIAAPASGEEKSANDIAADAIAPDDAPVG